jgi:hypothetical protein
MDKPVYRVVEGVRWKNLENEGGHAWMRPGMRTHGGATSGESGIWVDRPSWTGCHPARPHSVTDPSACLAARSPLMEAPLNSPPHRAVMGLRPEPRPVITPTRLRASVGHATGRFYEICLKSRKTCRAGKVKAGTPSACIGHDLGMISHDRQAARCILPAPFSCAEIASGHDAGHPSAARRECPP